MPPTVEEDLEVAQYLDGLTRDMSFADMAARVRDRFGRHRRWSRERIRAYFAAKACSTRGRRFEIDRSPELRAFILKRCGRMSLDEMVAACRVEFPGVRLPARSSFHRFVARERSKARVTAGQNHTRRPG